MKMFLMSKKKCSIITSQTFFQSTVNRWLLETIPPQPRYNQHSACWPSRSAAWNECDPRGTAEWGEMRMVGMLGRPKGEGIMGWKFRLNRVMVAWKLLDNEMMLVDTLRSQCHIAWPKRKQFPTSYASCRTTGNQNNRNNFGSKNWFPNLTPKKCLSSYQPVRPRQTEKCGIFFGGVWTQVP